MRACRWAAVALLGLAVGCSSPDESPDPTDTSVDVVEPRPIPPTEAPHLVFRDITAWAGLDFPGNATATGASFIDLDGDGDDDLLIGGPEGTHVLHNRGDGSFERGQVIDADPPMVHTYGIELTGDDRMDVLLIHELGAEVWQNTAEGLVSRRDILLFEDLVLQPGVATFGAFGPSGHDLFLGRSVIKDDGNSEPTGPQGEEIAAPDALFRRASGSFADVTEAVGLALDPLNTLSAMTVDLDDDGLLDLIIGTQHDVPDRYLKLGADGRFADAGELWGLVNPMDIPLASTSAMGFDAADVDGDGDLDLYLTDDNPAYGDRLYLKGDDGKFHYATVSAGLEDTRVGVGWGVGLHDFDHDGDVDLFVANGRRFYPADVSGPEQENTFFHGDGAGHFERVSPPGGSGLEAIEQSFGAVFSDIDNDGDIDVLIQNANKAPTLLRNDGASGNWLQLELRHPTLRPAVGAIVTATVGPTITRRWVKGTPSFGGSSSEVVHFGLGEASEATVSVRWPDGTVSPDTVLKTNQRHILKPQ
ncbi:MAG: hypothetical protein ACI9OJ_002120 [Myxococcota bacterium]|jgi:hypothetical protein